MQSVSYVNDPTKDLIAASAAFEQKNALSTVTASHIAYKDLHSPMEKMVKATGRQPLWEPTFQDSTYAIQTLLESIEAMPTKSADILALSDELRSRLESSTASPFSRAEFVEIISRLKMSESRQIQRAQMPPPSYESIEFLSAGDRLSTSGGINVSGGRGSNECWSSRQMAKLMPWRNSEEQMGSEVSRVRSFINLGKKAVTECCLPLLAVTAIIETVAYKALKAGATLLSLISKHPQKDSEEHPQEVTKKTNIVKLNSPEFTTLWICITLWKNIFQRQLPPNEDEARRYLFNGRFSTILS